MKLYLNFVLNKDFISEKNMPSKVIGKCSKCDKVLKDDDIEDIHFRGYDRWHHAYICLNCKFIIGFSAV